MLVAVERAVEAEATDDVALESTVEVEAAVEVAVDRAVCFTVSVLTCDES